MGRNGFKKGFAVLGTICFMAGCAIMAGKKEAAAQTTGEIYKQLLAEDLDENYLYGDYIYPSEKRNGFYYLKTGDVVSRYENNLDIMFCDAQSGEIEKVLTIDGIWKDSTSDSVYLTDNSFYYVDDCFYYLTNRYKDVEENDVTIRKSLCYVHGVDLMTGEEIVKFDAGLSLMGMNCVGVDHQGRIYVAGYRAPVSLYSPDGTLLSATEENYEIEKFFGFDPVNGNFYFRGNYSWRYWGYSHQMASLQAGNVTDDIIKIKGENITVQYQSYFYEHNDCAEMISDRYLADLSTFSGDRLAIVDSNAYDYNDVAATETIIDVTSGSPMVTLVAVENQSVIKLTAETFDSAYEDAQDYTSAGTRCVYNPVNGNIIVATGRQELTEYDIDTGKPVAVMTTRQPIFKIMCLENTFVILERTDAGEYYLETKEPRYPTKVTVKGPASLSVGDSAVFTREDDGTISYNYMFESSDDSILSIDTEGNAAAWKAGTATISVISEDGSLKDSMMVTVTAKETEKSRDFAALLPGAPSDNQWSQLRNLVYGHITDSYLVDTGAGCLMRVEYMDGTVIVEEYSAENELVSSRNIEMELPVFGGFYAGKDNYYLVFGQENTEESDTAEVLRVVKYAKDWERIADCKISGINTYMPFDAGSLSMTETDSILYIHTCHTMYQSEDGYRHQANMTFAVDKSAMEVTDSYTGVMNLSEGYVSHSFNQFIQTDGSYVYRVDQGDANPRGVAITRFHVEDCISDVSYTIPLKFAGNSMNNYTGSTLSGMELSDTDILVAGNYTNTNDNLQGTRNIFVIAADCNFEEEGQVHYITDYESDSGYMTSPPKLIKIDGAHFLLIWREENTADKTASTKIVQLDNEGNKVGDVITTNLNLSECQPVLLSDGTISWYATDDNVPVLYNIDPFQLEAVSGGVTLPVPPAIQKEPDTSNGTTEETTRESATSPANPEQTTMLTVASLTYRLNDNKTATLVSADKSVKTCKIPGKVYSAGTEYKVTGIGASAFANCRTLKKITIGANVKEIGAKAFAGCSKLEKIVLPSKTSQIGANAFKNCKKLKTITIKSKSLTSKSVSKNAFKGVSKKVTIKVPKKKAAEYKKLLRKKGLSSKVKVK